MRNKIGAILGILLLVLAIACAGTTAESNDASPLWEGVEEGELLPSDVMLVFYKIVDNQFLWWCDSTTRIIDNDDGTWDVISSQVTVRGVKQAYVDYGYYQYEPIDSNFKGTVAELLLTSPTASDLPKDQHIGIFLSVNITLDKPITALRYWNGMAFESQCLMTESVWDMMLNDTINYGDYVVIDFVDEYPGIAERNLAIVVDKVWSE